MRAKFYFTIFTLSFFSHAINAQDSLVNALAKEGTFDNYFCEVDPFSTQAIVDKIATLPSASLREFVLKHQNTFSFFAFEPEFNLLQQLVKSKTTIIGTEQIFLLAAPVAWMAAKQWLETYPYQVEMKV